MGKHHDSINLHSMVSKPGTSSSNPTTTHHRSKLFNWRCCCCTLISLIVLIAGIAVVSGIFAYLRWENERIERLTTHEHLQRIVEQINNSPHVRWKAKFNPFGVRVKDYDHHSLKNITAIKQYFGHIEAFFRSPVMEQHLRELEEFPTQSLPRTFDAREKWSHCPSLHHVPNQGGCGSCYATASMGVASDRSCIHSNGTYRSELSVQDVLGCCQACGNCYGGDPIKALTFWALEGVVTGGHDGCRPYAVHSDCGTPCRPDEYTRAEASRTCERQCQAGYYKNTYEKDKNFGSIAYTLYPRKMSLDQAGKERVVLPSVIGYFNSTAFATIGRNLTVQETRDIIQKELLLYGPTTLALPLTEEFLHYESGIFHPVPDSNLEKRIIYWHVVRLIGWGHDDHDQLYWIAINSFGSEWGENGLFRVDPALLERFGLEYETGLL
ncbi:papain family cysteine protease domain-containing protein [Ditylenchus destructor]|nr:papain family cysteine protease domain-containing protein [Ditylenchus destructor]